MKLSVQNLLAKLCHMYKSHEDKLEGKLNVLGTSLFGREIKSIRSSCMEVFCKKGVLKNLEKFTGKQLCWSLFFNKVAGLMSVTLLKKSLKHWCFPVNFAKFLRTLFS